MSVPQENFEAAVINAAPTLKMLYGVHPKQIDLGKANPSSIQTWMWDLEAIAAALRLELNNRGAGEQVDLG